MQTKISKQIRDVIKNEALKVGLSYNVVKDHYLKAIAVKATERREYFNKLNQESIERKLSAVPKNECPIAILRNPVLLGLLKAKDYMYREIDRISYRICIGKDTLTFHSSSSSKALSYEQLILLSAIYSQLMKQRKEKTDVEGRYKISLRSIYEYVHGTGVKWCNVDSEFKKIELLKIYNLYNFLNTITNGVYEYTYKDDHSRFHTLKKQLDRNFFLKMDLHDSPDDGDKDRLEWEKNGYSNVMLYVKPTPMFDIVMLQKCFTTLPAEMLDIKNHHEYDALKYFLAYRVIQSRKSEKIRRVVKYNGLKELFGNDHRDFVKRYFKFLADKGYIKNLQCDKDAVRWENEGKERQSAQ